MNCGKCEYFRGAPNMKSSKAWCMFYKWVVSKADHDPENKAPTCPTYKLSKKYSHD